MSLAVAKAAAAARGLPLYRYVGGTSARLLPVPMMNIINGGVHADNPIDFQEFMIMPVGAPSFAEGLRMGVEVFHTLKKALHDAGHNTNVGDEGGFAPNLKSADEALVLRDEGDRGGRLQAGRATSRWRSIRASTEFFKDGKYVYEGEGKTRSIEEQAKYLADLVGRYPIVSIEDGMAEDDLDGWKARHRPDRRRSASWSATTCSSPTSTRLSDGIKRGLGNSILVKVNQIGTLTETLAAVEMAHKAGYTAVMSHRSGETEDSTIADLAVATNCGQIKTGSLARSDRTAKYNQLLRIEQELGRAGEVCRQGGAEGAALTISSHSAPSAPPSVPGIPPRRNRASMPTYCRLTIVRRPPSPGGETMSLRSTVTGAPPTSASQITRPRSVPTGAQRDADRPARASARCRHC